MEYLNIETLELFTYLLFSKRSADKWFCSWAEDNGEYEQVFNRDIYILNNKLNDDIEKNNIKTLFDFKYEDKNKDNEEQANKKYDNRNATNLSICLKNELGLANFLRKYIDSFKNDNLGDGYFLYKHQIDYMEYIIKSYNKHYGNNFKINSDFALNPIPTLKIPDDVKITEFILLLHFADYIRINNCEYNYTSEKVFSADIHIQLLKSLKEIFHELRKESSGNSLDKLMTKKPANITEEEIKILSLTKSNIKLKEMPKYMQMRYSYDSMKQKSLILRQKLAVDNLHEALRIFEEKYFILPDLNL